MPLLESHQASSCDIYDVGIETFVFTILIDLMIDGDTSTTHETNDIANWLRQTYLGICVVSVEIDNRRKDSFSLPLGVRVEIFCAKVEKDPNLHQDFNLLRYSQKSVIVRGADVHYLFIILTSQAELT